MTNAPELRASDDDRDRVIAQLREHHAVGRLTAEEFQERVDQALATRTLGELAELTTDLPALSSDPPASTDAAKPSGRFSPGWRNAWATWASVSMVCFVIWLIPAVQSGQLNGMWWLWVAGPWGAIMFARWIFGVDPDDDKKQADEKSEVEGKDDGDQRGRELGGGTT